MDKDNIWIGSNSSGDMSQYSFTVLWSDEDEGYIALCPEFPKLSGFGETPEEALAEVRTALHAALVPEEQSDA